MNWSEWCDSEYNTGGWLVATIDTGWSIIGTKTPTMPDFNYPMDGVYYLDEIKSTEYYIEENDTYGKVICLEGYGMQ